jgi:hypothetical protein
MKEWVKRTIKNYAWLGVLDFCLECGCFIASKSFGHQSHLVVNIREVKGYDP